MGTRLFKTAFTILRLSQSSTGQFKPTRLVQCSWLETFVKIHYSNGLHIKCIHKNYFLFANICFLFVFKTRLNELRMLARIFLTHSAVPIMFSTLPDTSGLRMICGLHINTISRELVLASIPHLHNLLFSCNECRISGVPRPSQSLCSF